MPNPQAVIGASTYQSPVAMAVHRGGTGTSSARWFPLIALGLLAWVPGLRAQAGPPFQTDDPTPVDYGHYEAYVFGMVDGTPAEIDPTGPAFEFNWGAVPTIQLHAILPFGAVLPSNNPIYLPGGTGPSEFGLTDAELGVKWGFIKQTKHRPQIGTFTMLEVPTGSYVKGLGLGKPWYKLPLWVEKEFGPWSLVGGAGYAIVPQVGYRNYFYEGYLTKRTINKKLELAAEVFSHGPEGYAAPQIHASTMIDAGGYYHFKSPGLQLLFAYGHSIAGMTENYAYLGLYKTWGRDKKPN
ncbi:MAG TPA: transporter [Terriglobia bacterium]|nr:transporter [Terriglobia bacterium]